MISINAEPVREENPGSVENGRERVLIWRRKAAAVRSRIRRLERQLKELEKIYLQLDTAYRDLRRMRTLIYGNNNRKELKRDDPR
jgi:hypothetical protein